MRIELICFGSELLHDAVNSNVNAIAQLLAPAGLSLNRATTVGDDPREIELSLRESLRRAPVVLTSGGLGPTFDDLTRKCVSKILKKPLIFSQKILNHIQQRFDSRGLPMPQENERQAYLIGKAKPILNEAGTAPGQIIETKNNCVILLPGPTNELIPMMKAAVCPYLRKKSAPVITRRLTLHIFGLPESEIDEKIKVIIEKDWNRAGLQTVFGILAHNSIVDVKVIVQGRSRAQVEKALAAVRGALYKILGKEIYGENEETLESVVGKLLKARKETLSIAESCTGGILAGKVTNAAGSSLYFKEGVVAYSNQSKTRLLGVREKTLKKFGAVSCVTAEEMAKGVLKRAATDWAIAVTGIAGPGGGAPQKPVGLVCFAMVSNKELFSCFHNFFGSRSEIREKSALMALELFRKKLLASAH